MNYRNVHLPPPSELEPPQRDASSALPRLRRLKNDPAREYAGRPGQVERLPDSIAALILCKTGFSKVERNQIKVTHEGNDYYFASSDSVTIATKNGTDERVLWVINRHCLDVLHILGKDGEYIESIPRKGEAHWFSADEASREAYAEAKRMRNREASRLEELHGVDIQEAIERERHNAAEITRVVSTFPQEEGARAGDDDLAVVLPVAGRGTEPASTPFPRAGAIAAAIASTDAQRSRHEEAKKREPDARRVRNSKFAAQAAIASRQLESLAE